jgi:BirA family biotin operon repressor/biotin-[acetyl-CoA-carboxylase] ligase
MEMVAEASRVAFLVLGIGVNLNVERSAFPEEFRALATSLAAHAGRRVDRVAFARLLYQRLEQTLDACAQGGFAAVRGAFEARFRMPGRRVRVQELDGSEIAGIALGIDAQGALRVARDDGREVRIVAGDVTIAKEHP